MTIAIIFKIGLDCNAYRLKMQILSERKKIMAQATQEFLKIGGIQLINCKLHGIDHRKKLTTVDRTYFNFPLMRILVTYKKKGCSSIIVKSKLIYPADVFPYGRKTLGVFELIARQRLVKGTSWYNMDKIFDLKYGFSTSNLKASIARVNLVFARLLTAGLIQRFNVSQWLYNEQRSFVLLTQAYRKRLFAAVQGPVMAGAELFALNCHSPD